MGAFLNGGIYLAYEVVVTFWHCLKKVTKKARPSYKNLGTVFSIMGRKIRSTGID